MKISVSQCGQRDEIWAEKPR